MANNFYNRGATFNPDELADGDAIEAEFDAVERGFDTIETTVDTNKAGYPARTFHVAPATEVTHAVRKEQLDSHINDQGGVHGATSTNEPDKLVKRDSNGDIGARNFVGDCTGNANTSSNATQHINATGDVHGATSVNSPGNLMRRDANGDVAARTFIGDLQGIASASRSVSNSALNGGSATLVYGSMAGNDAFRILIAGTDDGGWAEIATADNGNDPIYVRQYTGSFVNATRTMTLLDGWGITQVPFGVNCTNGFSNQEEGAISNGISGGNGDGASSMVNNLRVSSWWGIGFSPSVIGQAVPYMEYSHWFDVRNGNAGMRGTLTQNSDLRLKENILSIPDALAKVCSLRGITYDRKDGGGRSTGVIAQEVQAVLPEAVVMADDEQGTLSVAYGNLVGLLIESIKELKTEVDQLKTAVATP